MSSADHSVLERLEDARQRWWTFSLLCNVLLAATLSLGILLAFILADVMLLLSQPLLATLFVTWCIATASLLVATGYRILRYQRTIEAAARRVELSFPELGSDLINLLQLSRSNSGAPEEFRQAAIAEAAARLETVRFQTAASRHSRWTRWRLGLQTPRDLLEFGVTLGLLVAATVTCSLTISTWGSSADRLFQPWAFVPQTGSIEILEVTPGDTEVLIGSRLEITARITAPRGLKPDAMVYFTLEGQSAEQSREMTPGEDGVSFRLSFPAVNTPMRYRLHIGDSQSEIYSVGVRDMPSIREVVVTYEYPSYLELPHLTIEQRHADLEAPQYTQAHLRLACSTRIRHGHVQTKDRQFVGQVGEDDHSLLVTIPMIEATTYTIHLFNEAGHTDADPRTNNLRVSVDNRPTIQLLKPPRESSCVPGDEISLATRAADDHGLGEVWLEWKQALDHAAEEQTSAQTEPGERIHSWSELKGATAMTLAHHVVMESDRFPAGQTVLVRAVARDRRKLNVQGIRLEPQETSSRWHRIQLLQPEIAAAETLERLESVSAKLWAILQAQLRARVKTAQLQRLEAFVEITNVANDIRQRQVQVQTGTSDLVRAIDPSQDKARAGLRQSLNKLAHGEMLRAVQQAEAAVRMKHVGEMDAHAGPLIETQDQIISMLRELLDLTRKATIDALADLKERPGGDLPDDVEEKLMELSEKLQEFLHQQKRVIEATENLAKKPVEDFSEEEEQLLEQLAAAEDEWSRFLEEMHSDFSKLPEQDFANSSLLEELVEVQTELEMAAGALTKKTADIAVPLEQLGAEMAEELVTNLEKWLPDMPDRERWSQEESLSDEMKEAPMAELPGELEDLVGELMEEEEDLFDEMEDVSSSAADSLDKGAGWDAADGPISNMSAKGVTGNRLPNTSEIGGRSGEGRQGKASGEFVGDTAVGKGGRKTPSRLAPDPYVKGQVKDLSKDPVGGATGGGKESGAGGEGLEGPVPPQQQRELERLANKQADLRNRAESVDLKFQIHNYHPTDLKKMIEMMEAVERDLRSGRYQSALRRREVLVDGLGSIKTYLNGEFEVRRDATSNLPEDIQKELLGSMSEASPAGWEELNRQYFERLSGEQEPPAVDATADDPPKAATVAEPTAPGARP